MRHAHAKSYKKFRRQSRDRWRIPAVFLGTEALVDDPDGGGATSLRASDHLCSKFGYRTVYLHVVLKASSADSSN